MVWQN